MRILVLPALLAVLAASIAAHALAQTPQGCDGNAPKGGFEVTSVRESTPTPPYRQVDENDPHSSDFIAENLHISQLIGEAFGIDDRFQVLGIPAWIGHRLFSVVAKDEGCRKALQRMDLSKAKAQKQLMIQALLRDRFQLNIHMETRMLPVDTLVQSVKSVRWHGPGLRGGDDQREDGYSRRGGEGVEITAKHMTTRALAGLLQGYLGTTVDDETHLSGAYDVDLRFNQYKVLRTVPQHGRRWR